MSTVTQEPEPTVRDLFQAIEAHERFMRTVVGYSGGLAVNALEMLEPYQYIGRIQTDSYGVPDRGHLERTIVCFGQLHGVGFHDFLGKSLSDVARCLGWPSTRPEDQPPTPAPAFVVDQGDPGEPRFGEFIDLLNEYHGGDWSSRQAAGETIKAMLLPYRSRAVRLDHDGIPDPVHLHQFIDAFCNSRRITRKALRDASFSKAVQLVGFYLPQPATPAVTTRTFGDLIKHCRDRAAEWARVKGALSAHGRHFPDPLLSAIESAIRDLLSPWDVADLLRCDRYGVPDLATVEEAGFTLVRMRLDGLKNPSEGEWVSETSSHRIPLSEAAELLGWPKKETTEVKKVAP